MKAVNLIPAEERRGGGAGQLGGLGGPTLGLIAALLLTLVAVVAWVTVSNGVAEREDDLAAIEANVAAAERQAAELAPYGQVAAMRQRSVDTVRSLAAMRVDWAAMLADLSRRMPADVTLTDLQAALPDPSAIVADVGADPAAVALPTATLRGCTTDHSAVARAMERMRGMAGVEAVALGTSDRGAGSGQQGCPRRDQFDVVLTFGTAGRSPVPAEALTIAPAPAEVAP